MRIYVDELPKEPRDCIFAKLVQKYYNFDDVYSCEIPNKIWPNICFCNCEGGCPYLKCLEVEE